MNDTFSRPCAHTHRAESKIDFHVLRSRIYIIYALIASPSAFFASETAFASWSPQKVGHLPQVISESFSAVSSFFIPLMRMDIAFIFPLQQSVNLTSEITQLFISVSISVEQAFSVLYERSIIAVCRFPRNPPLLVPSLRKKSSEQNSARTFARLAPLILYKNPH